MHSNELPWLLSLEVTDFLSNQRVATCPIQHVFGLRVAAIELDLCKPRTPRMPRTGMARSHVWMRYYSSLLRAFVVVSMGNRIAGIPNACGKLYTSRERDTVETAMQSRCLRNTTRRIFWRYVQEWTISKELETRAIGYFCFRRIWTSCSAK